MQEYTRGLAQVGARVHGVADAPAAALPRSLRRHLHDYLQVPALLDEGDVTERVTAWCRRRHIDRVEAQWEPLVLTAASVRERLGVPGMSRDTVLGFRDKQLMKERIAAAGLRVPHAFRVRTQDEAWAAAERVGYPLMLKPIAGAGSADTHRVDDADALRQVLAQTRHVPEVSIEEFVEGEEFTYDTVCIRGRPVYENVCQYLPRPLIARTREDIDPVICTIRDLTAPKLRPGIALGRRVLSALGMGTGFTHMEWYRKDSGEVVFGEIGCRPGGAHLVDQMNFTSDIDLFVEWARAVCWHSFEADATRRYCAAIVFKRARGQGVIRQVDGLEAFIARRRAAICAMDLLGVGQRRRDWKQTLLSDGYLIVRNPDFATAVAIAREAGSSIRMQAS